MAGYRRNKVYVLAFEDPELKGLEIRARGASVHLVLRAASLADAVNGITGIPSASQREALDEFFRIFAGCPAGCTMDHSEAFSGSTDRHYTTRMLSWNFEDDAGRPIEPTFENFTEQDIDLTLPVVLAWIEEVGGTPSGPLDSSSNSGGPALAESIPMETLSAGQQF